MYLDYFGFREPPFTLTPNPDFLYLSRCHQEAYAHLLYAIENRAGFIELSGEVGTGKTTLVRTLLGQLSPDRYRTALVFNPTLSPTGLLQEINRELGLPHGSTDTRTLHQELNDFLLAENAADRTVVLVIDEAQLLPRDVLEQVRLISNLETEREKLIQIVLVGQPELRELLGRDDLRQLQQRITVRYHLERMAADDIHEYIRHRLRIAANGREPVLFAPAAIRKIAAYSKGLPRLINSVCDRALLLAYTRDTREITASMADLAIDDLVGKNQRRPRLVWLVIPALILAAAASFLLLPQPASTPPEKAPQEPVQAIGPKAEEPPGAVGNLQLQLRRAGYYQGQLTGVYDPATAEAVKNFQQAAGLKADGKPGSQTLFQLYRRTGGVFTVITAAGASKGSR